MKNPPSPPIVRMSLAIYLPMMASGYFIRPPGSLAGGEAGRLALGLLTAALAGVVVVAVSRRVARRSVWGWKLHDEFRGILGGIGSGKILALSLLSSFGEEVLFRGVLQPRLGLFGAALLFAGLHFPYRRTLLPWTLFAFVLGLALGGLTEAFQSLWPAIALHFAVNFFNLHDLASEIPEPAGRE